MIRRLLPITALAALAASASAQTLTVTTPNTVSPAGSPTAVSRTFIIDPTTGLPVSAFGGAGGGGGATAVATTAAPSYTNGATVAISTDLAGNMRVRNDILAIVTGTIADTAYTGSGSGSLIAIAKGQDASLRSIVTNTTGAATAANQATLNSTASTISTNTGSTSTSLTTLNGKIDTLLSYVGPLASPNANSTNGLLAQLVTGASDTTPAHVIVDSGSLSISTAGLATSANQTTTNTTLDTISTTLQGTLATSGGMTVQGGNFTRPADTTAYAVGDIIGPSTAANCGTSCAIGFTAARNTTGTGYGIGGAILGVRVSKSDASTPITVRVHVFKSAPTNANGDNGAFAGSANIIAAVEVCYVDVALDVQGSDGYKGSAAPPRNLCGFTTNSGGQLFFQLETRTAFTPISAGTYTVAFEIAQD